MTLNNGFDYRERIGAGEAGTPLLTYLTERYSHSSGPEWRSRLQEGRVLVDGQPADPDHVLLGGEWVTWRRPPWQEPDAPLGLSVLHADDHVLAVDKPAGLPTLPSGGFLENTLLRRVRRRFPEAVPLHRLGRWTSGLLLLARTTGARRSLGRAWRDGKVEKRYRALASGRPGIPAFSVRTPIGPVPHALLGSVHAASPAGKPSHTRVQVLEMREGEFLASVTITTGRPHQIRIHLAAAGHPLVGDPLYPPGGVPGPESTALPGDPGYRLHAEMLRFPHPGNGRDLALRSPPPPVLRASFERFEENGPGS